MITNLKLTQYRKIRLNKKTKKNLIKKYNLTKKKKAAPSLFFTVQ
jgi:hypothetical protein